MTTTQRPRRPGDANTAHLPARGDGGGSESHEGAPALTAARENKSPRPRTSASELRRLSPSAVGELVHEVCSSQTGISSRKAGKKVDGRLFASPSSCKLPEVAL